MRGLCFEILAVGRVLPLRGQLNLYVLRRAGEQSGSPYTCGLVVRMDGMPSWRSAVPGNGLADVAKGGRVSAA
jgi:hypothetical protein